MRVWVGKIYVLPVISKYKALLFFAFLWFFLLKEGVYYCSMGTERIYIISEEKEPPPQRVFSNLQKLVEETRPRA